MIAKLASSYWFSQTAVPTLSPEHPTVVPITRIQSGGTTGISLVLAWTIACIAIHERGMSMDQATIDPGRKKFAFRLMFVALERAKSFQWLGVRAFDLDHYKCIEQEKCVEAGR